MDITDITPKGEKQVTYNEIIKNGINYRYHDTGKGFLLEKQIVNQKEWTNIGIAENQLAVDKYFSFLFNPPAGLPIEMRDKLLNAIVSQESINDMLKKNRPKRTSGLLDNLMKRL